MKPSIPKGTRDFLPEQTRRRQYIFDTLREVFELHAFEPIETPAMENLNTLTGKYGEEGDRLIYKILNSGDYLAKADQQKLADKNSTALVPEICDRALRYDLTVPLARYVVQHQHELAFPFRRYQIQPVWRADRPQKGRYREFFQCDVDMLGSDSLLNEVELLEVVKKGFDKLGLGDVIIRLNNRKILEGIAIYAGIADKFQDFAIALDKLDKIGWEKVAEELDRKEVSADSIQKLKTVLELDKNQKLDWLSQNLDSEIGRKGLEEMSYLLDAFPAVQLDLTLARGLDYYTGSIIEVGHKDFPSSICGGGRYDDLTGIFGLKDVSGVGISFGADRIYDLMEQKGLFEKAESKPSVLFFNFGKTEILSAQLRITELRHAGFPCMMYPDDVKIKKQFKYADERGFDFVAFYGQSEIEADMIKLKNQKTGDQQEIAVDDFANKFPNF